MLAPDSTCPKSKETWSLNNELNELGMLRLPNLDAYRVGRQWLTCDPSALWAEVFVHRELTERTWLGGNDGCLAKGKSRWRNSLTLVKSCNFTYPVAIIYFHPGVYSRLL